MDFTRHELDVLHTRSALLGTSLIVCDFAGYALCLAFVAYERAWIGQALFGAVAIIFVARLFMLGHDACHQALTPRRQLNRTLGTISLLPSLHPFSLWDLGHNRIHHRYTNQRDLDYVWEPLDPAEYAKLSAFARWRYRFYRTPIGHLAYYGVEIWWRKMFFPRPSEIGAYERAYVWDHVAVGLWTIALPVLLVALRLHWHPGASWADLASTLVWGWVVPVAGFNMGMSTVVYLHHTHPSVTWKRGQPAAPQDQIAGAVHVVLPGFLERTMHHIMEHPAHHARPGIPLYHLKDGQAVLEERHDCSIVQRWSLPFHLDTLRRCKLFDLSERRWVGFDVAHRA